MKSFLYMLSFFTSIPVRMRYQLDDVHFRRGIKYLPLIALLIGAAVAGAFVLGGFVAPYFAALVSLVAYLVLTGGLHIDGLADTMDGVLSRRDRVRILEIMKDSRIGTFGVLGIGVYIAGMIIFSAQLDWVAVGLYPLVGRTAALMAARHSRCARPGGLGQRFTKAVHAGHGMIAVAIYLAIAAADSTGWQFASFDVVGFVACVLPYVLALALCALFWHSISKKLGGITGDVIGFCIEAAQWLYLFFCCVAYKLV